MPACTSASPAAASPGQTLRADRRPRAAAQQRLAGRHEAEHLHGDRQRTARRIAADQRHVMTRREFHHAARRTRRASPRRPAAASTPAGPGGRRAHRRQVAEIHGQRAMPDRARRAAAGKCRPSTSVSIAATSSAPSGTPQQRRIVADAEHDAVARSPARRRARSSDRSGRIRRAPSGAAPGTARLSARPGAARAPRGRAPR